ncbi:MAG: alpha/beta hydrolase [Firmicutes bacterium]|nr:alpha/beta hydrolase [Bacillota bacterium]
MVKKRYIIIVIWCILLIFISFKIKTNKINEDISKEISIKSEDGTLYGTLELPKEKEKYPVILIISGSGPTDRNGNSNIINGKNDSLKLLSEALKHKNIATLRYDKRKIGKSKGFSKKEEEIRFDDFIKDAILWIEKLKKDDRFTSVSVLGHSEGSTIGMITARKAKVDSYISLCGPGRSLDKILLEQYSKDPKNYKEVKYIINKLNEGNLVKNVSKELLMAFRPSVQPFLISQMKYKPAKEISKLDVPVLIISGSKDLQVSVTDGKLLKKASSLGEYKVIKNMNHVLKKVYDIETNKKSYCDPTIPLADELVEKISEFIKK